MYVSRLFNRYPTAAAAVWVALCFLLTSAVYLSWVYLLVDLTGGAATDWLSMVVGYILQAAGTALVAQELRERASANHRRRFCIAALLLAATAVPALLSGHVAGALSFGYAMNLLCGVIAGYYLYGLASKIGASHRAIAFGGGYALATAALGALSLPFGNSLLRSRWALPVYLAATAMLAALTWRLPLLDGPGESIPRQPGEKLSRKTLLLACGAVVLMSLVKNLGFGFPSSDIEAGLKPELWRLFYALGLVAAGFINDRSRRYGMVCTVAALILPFVMLAVSNEPVSGAICWSLDYLFYGFFSVFRVVLFMDLAQRTDRWGLAPLGLALGRVGDAAGTALCLAAGGNTLLTVAITSVLFVAAVLVLFQLYRVLYESTATAQQSEREVFETFSHQHDLSSREREVLRLVLDERSNGEIAEALFVSESTIKYHVHNLLKKTGCKSRLELLKKYHAALYPGMEKAV